MSSILTELLMTLGKPPSSTFRVSHVSQDSWKVTWHGPTADSLIYAIMFFENIEDERDTLCAGAVMGWPVAWHGLRWIDIDGALATNTTNEHVAITCARFRREMLLMEKQALTRALMTAAIEC